MSQNTDLPTVRAAIAASIFQCNERYNRRASRWELADAILATLSDPAVQDELARWLIEQKDGSFIQMFDPKVLGGELYWMRWRTRTEEQG